MGAELLLGGWGEAGELLALGGRGRGEGQAGTLGARGFRVHPPRILQLVSAQSDACRFGFVAERSKNDDAIC